MSADLAVPVQAVDQFMSNIAEGVLRSNHQGHRTPLPWEDQHHMHQEEVLANLHRLEQQDQFPALHSRKQCEPVFLHCFPARLACRPCQSLCSRSTQGMRRIASGA